MSIILYDLAGAQDQRFSPNCWRSRLAIAHKQQDCEARPTRFSDIAKHAGEFTTIPTIIDGDETINDSWAIAAYLERQYDDQPSLFAGPGGIVLSQFFQHWVNNVMHPGVAMAVILDIHDHLDPADQPYFRQSREQRFGQSLEDIQAGREGRLEGFRKSLAPLRLAVKANDFVGGAAPLYADYLAFGALQWARVISDFRLLEDDDPVADWFQRCLDLYNGLGRSEKGYYWND